MSHVLPGCPSCLCGRFWTWQEDGIRKTIVMHCVQCKAQQDYGDTLIWKRQYQSKESRSFYRYEHGRFDPTLPRVSKDCPKCSETQAVYFQEPDRFVFQCLSCSHVF